MLQKPELSAMSHSIGFSDSVIGKVKDKVFMQAKWPIRAGTHPVFLSMKRLGVFLLPLEGMLVHRRVTHSSKFAGTHLYTWVKRDTVSVKCLA